MSRTTATAALAGAFAAVAGGGFLAARALRRRRTLEGGIGE